MPQLKQLKKRLNKNQQIKRQEKIERRKQTWNQKQLMTELADAIVKNYNDVRIKSRS